MISQDCCALAICTPAFARRLQEMHPGAWEPCGYSQQLVYLVTCLLGKAREEVVVCVRDSVKSEVVGIIEAFPSRATALARMAEDILHSTASAGGVQ